MSPPAARPDEIGARPDEIGARPASAPVANGTTADQSVQPAAAENYWSPLQDLIDRSDLRLLRQLLPSTPGWFIEVGSGWGRLLPAYQRPDREIVFVDSHLGILETARKQNPPGNVHFVRADACRLPFRPDVFSAGLCVRAFQELAAPEAFLHEVARVLRPQARFVLSYANKRNLLRILRYGRRGFRHDHEPAGERMFVTHPRYLERLLPPAGLSRVRARGSGLVEQLLRPGRLYAPALALPFLFPFFLAAERTLSFVLGPLDLLPHNFLLLRKERPAAAPATPAGSDPRTLAAILACPACRGFPLTPDSAGDSFLCSSCARRFARTHGVWDFALPPSGQ